MIWGKKGWWRIRRWWWDLAVEDEMIGVDRRISMVKRVKEMGAIS